MELNAAGDAYTIKSMTNQASIVNITVSKAAPGFQVGADGTTKFGFKEKEPWGAVRHVFWPRNKVGGTIMTKEGPIDVKGRALFIHALQDMKPHHAAAKWSFCDFAGDKYSAIMMEFTTPPSYASTVVNVGGIVSDSEIIMAGSSNTVAFPTTTGDAQNDWPEPTSVKFAWDGKTKDGKPVSAVIEGPYGDRLDKVDVMAEVPKFVKQIVAGAVGTKPYIYQVRNPSSTRSDDACSNAVFSDTVSLDIVSSNTSFNVHFQRHLLTILSETLTYMIVWKAHDFETEDWRRRGHRARPPVLGSNIHFSLGGCLQDGFLSLDTLFNSRHIS